MKHLFLLPLLLFILCSCENSKEDTPAPAFPSKEQVIGSWKISSASVTYYDSNDQAIYTTGNDKVSEVEIDDENIIYSQVIMGKKYTVVYPYTIEQKGDQTFIIFSNNQKWELVSVTESSISWKIESAGYQFYDGRSVRTAAKVVNTDVYVRK